MTNSKIQNHNNEINNNKNNINNLLNKVNKNITTTETNDSFSSITITEIDKSITNKLNKHKLNKNDIVITK